MIIPFSFRPFPKFLVIMTDIVSRKHLIKRATAPSNVKRKDNTNVECEIEEQKKKTFSKIYLTQF